MLKSTVATLPDELRSKLEAELIRRGFSDYSGVTDWFNELLKDEGYVVSRSAVYRHGSKFEDRLNALKIATDQAKVIAKASEDDAGALNDALIRLVQTKMFEVLIDLDADDKNLSKIGQAIAKLSQAAVRQKKWQQEMGEKIRKEALEEAAEKVGKNKNIAPETLKAIREDIYGLV